MLSPPRLPALCIAFHAGACYGQSLARYGLNGRKWRIFYMQIHARYACTALYKAARQKKASGRQRTVKKSRWLCSGSVRDQ